MRAPDRKIVIVTRQTRLQGLIARFNTRSQAKFYVTRARQIEAVQAAPRAKRSREPQSSVGDFSDYEREDQTYREVIERLHRDLDFGMKIQVIDRAFLPNFVFGPNDIVVPVGQDGLVANTAKYALDQPIVAINPDPARFDGILLPFTADQARLAVGRTLDGTARTHHVSLAEATLADGQRLLAFNDLFIGCRTHVSARYRIEIQSRTEPHSSSGIIVSTGAGSTGWLSSVFNMAGGLSALSPAAKPPPPIRLAWDDPRLVYIVREPFISKASRASIVAGMLGPEEELIIESMMPADGVIFSDGIESDFLQFNSGAIAHIKRASRFARLVY